MNAEDTLQFVLDSLEDAKAESIDVLDVKGKSDVTDMMVVASGTSSRHVKSIAINLAMDAKQSDIQPLGIEGENEGEWVLVDLGDVVVHIMQPRIRELYQLEKLWEVSVPKVSAPKDIETTV